MTRLPASLGAVLFLLVAPGTVAGLVPYWLTRWRSGAPFLVTPLVRVVGAGLIALGLASLLESFGRFALVGLGTPAPVAPPTRLVVSGQYRYVRNPMYVAVLALVIGQAVLLGRASLLRYAALLWALFHGFVVLYEEPKLRSLFGASYEAYCRHVRRWWPRARAWEGEADAR